MDSCPGQRGLTPLTRIVFIGLRPATHCRRRRAYAPGTTPPVSPLPIHEARASPCYLQPASASQSACTHKEGRAELSPENAVCPERSGNPVCGHRAQILFRIHGYHTPFLPDLAMKKMPSAPVIQTRLPVPDSLKKMKSNRTGMPRSLRRCPGFDPLADPGRPPATPPRPGTLPRVVSSPRSGAVSTDTLDPQRPSALAIRFPFPTYISSLPIPAGRSPSDRRLRFSKRSWLRMNANCTVPVGPFRCLAMMTSACPGASSGS